MKNFAPCLKQNHLMPSLFIGYVDWPDDWSEDLHLERIVFTPGPYDRDKGVTGPVPVDVKLPPHFTLIEHQTAGHACHQVRLFGVFFELLAHDPLMALEEEYYESQIGWGTSSWSSLKELETRLSPMGLAMSEMGYTAFQEGFIPFDAEGAFSYALEHALGLLLSEGGLAEWKTLWPDYNTLEKALREAYDAAKVWRPWPTTPEQDGWHRLSGSLGECVVGGFVFANCD